MEDINPTGSVIVTAVVSKHPFASVTVAEYIPATNPFTVAVVELLDHKKVYGVVPPVVPKETEPFANPLQVTLVEAFIATIIAVGSVIVLLAVMVAETLSVIVTVYEVADKPKTLAVVEPSDHK